MLETALRLGVTFKNLVNRAGPRCVALETTLLVHGVPRGQGRALAAELRAIVAQEGATPAFIGVVSGTPVVGMTEGELDTLFAAESVAKANSSNLGAILCRGEHAATTVSTTMELAAAAGVQVFATGGLGGVHRSYGEHLDISSDLGAFTRFPVAVVSSGVKSILDVEATREVLETLGIPVAGYQSGSFPAFYLRDSTAQVDARFDDVPSLAEFVAFELRRTGRGIVIANPIAREHELARKDWDGWLTEAQGAAQRAGIQGREVTPFVLGRLHEVSGGKTLRANLELIKANTRLAAQVSMALSPRGQP